MDYYDGGKFFKYGVNAHFVIEQGGLCGETAVCHNRGFNRKTKNPCV
jgi:hypothetical protein